MHGAVPRRTASAATDTLFDSRCEAGKMVCEAMAWSASALFLRLETGIGLMDFSGFVGAVPARAE
jgi:hypothetical protein